MDASETTTTDGSLPDGGQVDSPSAGAKQKPSQEKQGTEGAEKTYTKAEVDELIRKRHSTLDSRLAAAGKRIKELEESDAEHKTSAAERTKRQLDDEERAELIEAGDDTEKRKRVEARYAELRRGEDLKSQNEQLQKKLSSFEKADVLLQTLNVEDIDELVKLLEGAQVFSQEKHLKRLSEAYSVSEGLIKPLLKLADTPEQLEDLVKELSDKFPAGAKLPPPVKLSGTPVGEKTREQRLNERYPTMK